MKSELITPPDFARRGLWKILRWVLGFFGTCLFLLSILDAFCCDSLLNSSSRAYKSVQVQLAGLEAAKKAETEIKEAK
jgi:hypothetical protein